MPSKAAGHVFYDPANARLGLEAFGWLWIENINEHFCFMRQVGILLFRTVSVGAMGQRALTERQKEVLAFVEERQSTAGFPPTVKEIAEHFGFRSANSVRQHLRLIESKGLVKRLPRRSRALVVPKQPRRDRPGFVRIPVLGSIAAGSPILATENTESVIEFPASLFRGTKLFAVRVRGRSMEGAGILDGDLAVLDAAGEVAPGGIGAVLIGDEATLKHVHLEGGTVRLRAANPDFADLKVALSGAGHVRLIGCLVGVVRKF